MDKSHIVENNILIAKFLRLEEIGDFYYVIPFDRPQPGYSISSNCPANRLEFYWNWHWIMFVVEKINDITTSTGYESNGMSWSIKPFCVIIDSLSCEILDKTGNKRISKISIKKHDCSLANAVWLACVEFIKWYNRQQ